MKFSNPNSKSTKYNFYFSDIFTMNRILLLFLLPFHILIAQSGNNLNAFGDTPWGASFKEVKEKFVSLMKNPDSSEDIKILNEVKNRLIVIKRNNVTYTYRFYKEPKEVKESRELAKLTEGADKPDHKAVTGLYSVGLQFAPVDSNRVKDSLKKYGSPTREYLVENSYGILIEKKAPPVEKKAELNPGEEEPDLDETTEAVKKIPMAFIWDLSGENNGAKEGGFILQWNEPYSKKLYTKRLDYFSAEITSLINEDFKKYFSNNETKILADLLTDIGSGGGKTNPQPTPN
jgi:hypothetical protein